MSKKPGRNDPCSCGSGRKTKRCCGRPGAVRSGVRVDPLPWTLGGTASLEDCAPLDGLDARVESLFSIEVSPVEHPPPLASVGELLEGELRVFEVVEVVDGFGYRVVEVRDAPGEPIWVDDPDGSWMAAPGTLFAGRFGDDASIAMPTHDDCPLCRAERERRMKRAGRSRSM